jgi:hypothetical protein
MIICLLINVPDLVLSIICIIYLVHVFHIESLRMLAEGTGQRESAEDPEPSHIANVFVKLLSTLHC